MARRVRGRLQRVRAERHVTGPVPKTPAPATYESARDILRGFFVWMTDRGVSQQAVASQAGLSQTWANKHARSLGAQHPDPVAWRKLFLAWADDWIKFFEAEPAARTAFAREYSWMAPFLALVPVNRRGAAQDPELDQALGYLRALRGTATWPVTLATLRAQVQTTAKR